MKKVFCLLFVFTLLINLISCNYKNEREDPYEIMLDNVPNELKDLYLYDYYYDYCSYLSTFSNKNIDNVTEEKKGFIYNKLDSESKYKYKEVNPSNNLDALSLKITYNSRLSIKEIFKRYDLYLDNEFIYKSYFVDISGDIHVINLERGATEGTYAIKIGFCIKPYYGLSGGVFNEINENKIISKEEFTNAIPKMLEEIQKKPKDGKLLGLFNIFPSVKCVLEDNELSYQHYVISDNFILSVYSKSTPHLVLAYYNNEKQLTMICDNPNYYVDFIEVYDNNIFGIYYLENNLNIYLSLPLISYNNERTFTLFTIKNDETKKIKGNYTIENDKLTLFSDTTASQFYFKISKNKLIYEGENIVSFAIKIDLERDDVLIKNHNLDLSELEIIFSELNIENVNFISGFYSMISSYIYVSENKSIIGYVIEKLKQVNFVEKLTEANREASSSYGNRLITFSLKGGNDLCLELTNNGYIYIIYLEKQDDHSFKQLYAFKSDCSDLYYFFTQFMGMGTVEYYYKEEILDKNLDCNQSLSVQKYIVRKYIASFSDLAEYYKTGYKFSGSLKYYCGKFNDYHAVMVDGAGIKHSIGQQSEIIAGITFNYPDSNRIYLIANKCYSLQEAYEKNIITYNDLLKIKTNYEILQRTGKIRIKYNYEEEEKIYWAYFKNEFFELDLQGNNHLYNVINNLNWERLRDLTLEQIDSLKYLKYEISLNTTAIFVRDDKALLLFPLGEEVLVNYQIDMESGTIIMNYVILSSIINSLYSQLNEEELRTIIEIFNLE